jgi:hypothetical protein
LTHVEGAKKGKLGGGRRRRRHGYFLWRWTRSGCNDNILKQMGWLHFFIATFTFPFPNPHYFQYIIHNYHVKKPKYNMPSLTIIKGPRKGSSQWPFSCSWIITKVSLSCKTSMYD